MSGGSVAVMLADAWDVSTVAGTAALAVAVAAAVVLALLWRSTAPTRIEPGPATMDLGDETPALVDLLVGGFEVEDDAVPATVVDLAARRLIEIDAVGDRTTIRVRQSAARDELTAYEQRVLRHIERQAIDGVAPVEVLAIGPDGVSERWFTGFVREVNRHGQELGLCRRRFDLKHLAMAWGVVVVGAGPAYLVGSFGSRTADPTGWGSIGNLFVGLAFLVGFGLVWIAQRISRSNAQVDTSAGREAAARWLGVRDHLRSTGDFSDKPAASVAIWDRYLAYATAMGLAPTVQSQIPFETEHDRHAWSRVTGEWRRVKVRYQAFVPSWGEHPGSVAFGGAIRAGVAGLFVYAGFYMASADLGIDSLSDQQRQWIGFAGLIVAVVAACGAIFGLVQVLLGLSDLFARRTIEGEVVRKRTYRSGHRLPKIVQWAMWSGRDEHGMRRDYQRRTRHHVAIDDGGDESVVAFQVRQDIFGQVSQGARVRAIVTPRLGYVRAVEMLAAPRPSAASERTTLHPLAEESASKAGARTNSSLERTMQHLETAIGDDGRPLLDQTDDEGVTMRERLAQSSSELDRLRNDPRLRNSPVGGLLDAFLSGGDEPDDDRSADADADADEPS